MCVISVSNWASHIVKKLLSDPKVRLMRGTSNACTQVVIFMCIFYDNCNDGLWTFRPFLEIFLFAVINFRTGRYVGLFN